MAENVSQCILPPSPNWYCSSICDCSLDSLYVFGARNGIYVFDVSKKPLQFRGQLEGHRERVTAVKFCRKFSHRSLLVSGGEDLYLKLWDATSGVLIDEHDKHPAKVTAVSWSYHVTDLIASGDEAGNVFIWYYGQEEVNHIRVNIPSSYIFCLEFSPHQENQLAVGHKNGSVSVLQVKGHTAEIIHHLKGHDDEVQSISWCPTIKLDLGTDSNSSPACLLASGSRDRTIRLWDTSSGRTIKVLKLPAKTGAGPRARVKTDDQGKSRVWLSICWNEHVPEQLLSGSLGGDLLAWDLTCNDESKQAWKVFQCSQTQGHSRVIFNVTCSPNGKKVMTNSMDRQIILWDFSSQSFLWPIYTLGGFVYGLVSSHLDPGRMAVGVGDSMIRIWDILSPQGEAVVLWQGIKTKVMTLCWHPVKEGLLAFGTEDGRVGIYNIMSQKPEISSTYHKKAVYSLAWGPQCQTAFAGTESVWCLYSCSGDGMVYEHIPGQLQKEAIDVNAMIKRTNNLKHRFAGCTEVAWDQEGSLLAMGHEDGAIEIFTPPLLRKKCNLHMHHKSITCLAWHPGHTNTQGEKVLESCRFWLASGSNESVIHIHDLSKVGPDKNVFDITLTHSYRHLGGHSGRITKLSWSPHSADLLVSSCYDGTAQVWNVVKGEGLCNFREHTGRVMSVMWSYLEPDVIYSGGDDFTVRYWRVSQQHHTLPPGAGKKTKGRGGKKKTKKRKSDSESAHDEAVIDEHKDQEIVTTHETTREDEDQDKHVDAKPVRDKSSLSSHGDSFEEEVFENAPSLKSSNEATTQITCPKKDPALPSAQVKKYEPPSAHSTMEEPPKFTPSTKQATRAKADSTSSSSAATKKRKAKVKSLFPLSAVADNKSKSVTQEECVLLTTCLYGGDVDPAVVPGSGDHINLGFFTDRSGAYTMMAEEGDHHRNAANVEYQCNLEIWKGNLSGAMEMAKDQKQISDGLLALCPLGGQVFWLSAAEAYAEQLTHSGQYLKASMYYLACHKVYEAIDVLATNAMYREATALAKVRLSDQDPVLADLYCTWARKSEGDGSYEHAAKCYLAARLPSDAARVLSRRGDAASFKTAAQIAYISGQPSLGSSLALNSVHLNTIKGNWNEVHEVFDLDTKFKVFQLNSLVHEFIVTEMIKKEFVPVKIFPTLIPSNTKWEDYNGTNADNPIMQILKMNWQSPDEVYAPWYSPIPSQSTVFVPMILNAWCSVCDLDQDTDYQLFYDQLSQHYSATFVASLDSLQQVLLNISYEVTLGLVSLLSGNLRQTAVHWLTALSLCYSESQLDIQKYLCALLLPHGAWSWNMLQKVVSRSCQSKDEAKQCKRVDGFSHFLAFYSAAQLLEMWWNYPRMINNRGTLVPSASGIDVPLSECKLQNGSKSEGESVIQEPNLPDVNKNTLESAEASNEMVDKLPLSASADLPLDVHYTELLNTTTVLLSESHAHLAALKHQLKCVQTTANSVKAQLKIDAVTAGVKHGKGRGIDGRKKEKIHGEPDEKPAVMEKAAPMDEEKAAKVEACEETEESKEEEASLEELELEKANILAQIEENPLKDLKFPDPVESALILTHITSHRKNPTPELMDLGRQIVTWGLRHACTEQQKKEFEKRKQHFDESLSDIVISS